MFRSIIAGYEGPDRGRHAVAFARVLADATGASLLLVGAHPQQPLPLTASSRDEHDRTERALRAVRDELAPNALVTAVGALSPAHALCHLAERRNADLVVVGSSHHGRADRLRRADHSLQVLHGAGPPVAVVPDARAVRDGLRRIVAGIDGSPESLDALRVAADLARAARAAVWIEVAVSDVVPAWPNGIGFAPPYAETGAPVGAREDAERLLRRALEDLDGVDADGRVVLGEPVKVLAAATATADLLVVGSRRWGPVSRVLLGSTSEAVVRRSTGPVLVVPRGAGAGGAAGQRDRRSGGRDLTAAPDGGAPAAPSSSQDHTPATSSATGRSARSRW